MSNQAPKPQWMDGDPLFLGGVYVDKPETGTKGPKKGEAKNTLDRGLVDNRNDIYPIISGPGVPMSEEEDEKKKKRNPKTQLGKEFQELPDRD